jgi:hypothetical protein
MSVTVPTPTLDQLVTAFHRKSLGLKADPAHGDFASAFTADPVLLASAQAEQSALASLNAAFNDKLAQRDYNQYTRMVALNGMLNSSQPKEATPT